MQFLLKSIGDAKEALHYFYDITRADFNSVQASFYGRLTKYVESRGEAKEYDESSHFYLLYAQDKRLENYVKNKIEKGKYFKSLDYGYGYIYKTYYSEKQYYEHEINEKYENHTYSQSPKNINKYNEIHLWKCFHQKVIWLRRRIIMAHMLGTTIYQRKIDNSKD
eukprot:Mrub_07923.p2 GENE.Mrub_07923~~Mrub_07923.p2  ORF type:complete len:165 (-),score=31.15 Mrub_07923:104-598(-)